MLKYLEWLTLLFPALGALANGLAGHWIPRRVQNWIACGAVLGTLLVLAPMLAGQAMEPGLVGHSWHLSWIKVWTGSEFILGVLALRIDALSLLLALGTTIVGLIIHLHVARQLASGNGRHVALALLNGALAAVLLLQLSDNFWTLLLGWALSGWAFYALRRLDSGAVPTMGFFLLSDLGLLIILGILSPAFASAPLDGVFVLSTSSSARLAVGGMIPILLVLIVIGAAIRSRLFPFHLQPTELPSSLPGVDAFVSSLLLTPAGVFLLVRLYPLLTVTPFASTLISWWGILGALLLALVALASRDARRRIYYLSFVPAGLLWLAVGQNIPDAATAFLPAYMLIQALLFLPQDTPRWTKGLGIATLAGFPLLPGFFFFTRLLATTWAQNRILWTLGTLTVLLTAASALLAALGQKPARDSLGSPDISPLIALLVFILSIFSLTSPPLLALFLEPVLKSAPQPGWGWYVIVTGIVGVGTALGYGLLKRQTMLKSRTANWIASAYLVHELFRIADEIGLRAGRFMAQTLDRILARWTVGVLSEWMQGRPQAADDSHSRPITPQE